MGGMMLTYMKNIILTFYFPYGDGFQAQVMELKQVNPEGFAMPNLGSDENLGNKAQTSSQHD